MARADVLNMMYSKNRSPLDFKFEQISAPPLLSFITLQDISELHRIATSLKYSGKIKLKYKLIDEIMTKRGFIKFHSGTNRVVYRCINDTSFVVKIALDRVGLGDNPAEYENQFELKPFVTKVFEVSPCGTVGSFERVEPITSREEFISVADDIFELLTEKVLGEYIMEDIGSNYFMNYGIRVGFGITILDFPYLYKLDGAKLYCTNEIAPNTLCDGLIDYDDGFNNLVCERCGKLYLATELKSNEATIKICKEGIDLDMRVTLKRGTEVIRESERSTDTIIRNIENNDIPVTVEEEIKPVIKKYPRKNNKNWKKERDERRKRDASKPQADDLDIIRNSIQSNLNVNGEEESTKDGSLQTSIKDSVESKAKLEEKKVEVDYSSTDKYKPKANVISDDTLQVPIAEMLKDFKVENEEQTKYLDVDKMNKLHEEALKENNEFDVNNPPYYGEDLQEAYKSKDSENECDDKLSCNINKQAKSLYEKYGLTEEDFEEGETREKITKKSTKDLY